MKLHRDVGMNQAVREALKRDRTVDITTTGRRSGQPRRIEIWMYNVNDRLYICGPPGKRGWYANMAANPAMTLHLKLTATANLAARARPITQLEERRAIFTSVLEILGQPEDLDHWTNGGPLVEIHLTGQE